VYSVSSVAPVGAFVSMVTESGTVGAGEAISLLKGSTPVSAGAFAEELDALVQSLRKAGIAASALEGVQPEDFCDHLRSLSPDIASALNRYLQFAGTSVVSGYSIDEKTLNEVPNLIKSRILGSLASTASADSGAGDVDAQIASVRSRLPQAQQADFDFWIDAARKVNRLRDERGIYSDTWAAGISRAAILEAGRRLAERGVLPEAELALECTEPELTALSRGGDNADMTGELVQRREWRRSARIEDCPEWLGVPPSADPPPVHLLPAGLRGAMKAVLAGMMHLNDLEPAPEVDRESDADLTLQGIAVSRGTYEGTARVISGPDDFGRIQQGDVLITKNTSAAFNAVLASLGALVTDRGGLLSHAAIVSREYGIPGVVATKRATHSIPDGSRVRVDGDNGTVSLLT
jgi:pyruvate,water dikinase